MKQLSLDFGLAPTPAFDNFVPTGNEAAFEHLILWANNPMRAPVPTYLWGVAGSGKTHLLKAVEHALRDQGETVGWLCAKALDPPIFDDHWSVILLDDCHLYTAQQQSQAFNWFVNAQNPVQGRARWVLAAGAVPPADLQLREDLRTRLGWGAVYQLHNLSDEQRCLVLQQAAAGRGVRLTDEVVHYLFSRFSRDLSSLMALLDRLDHYAMRTQRAITVALLKSMLENE